MLSLGDSKQEFIYLSGFDQILMRFWIKFWKFLAVSIASSFEKYWVIYVKPKSDLGWSLLEESKEEFIFTETFSEKKRTNRHTKKPTMCFKFSYIIQKRVISFLRNNIKPFNSTYLRCKYTGANLSMFKILRNILFTCSFFKNWTLSHIQMQGAVQL